MLTHDRLPHLILAAALLSTALLAGPGVAVAGKVRHAVATSPYICTPSGFGQKARCYLRSA